MEFELYDLGPESESVLTIKDMNGMSRLDDMDVDWLLRPGSPLSTAPTEIMRMLEEDSLDEMEVDDEEGSD